MMAKHRIIGLCFELVSLVSLQRQFFAFFRQDAVLQDENIFTPDEKMAQGVLTCLERRGQNGTWLPESEHSNFAQDSGVVGFVDRPRRTTDTRSNYNRQLWRWREDSACGIQKLDRAIWNQLIIDLEISRIYTTGDSTMKNVAQVLRSELFQPKIPTVSIEDSIALPFRPENNRTLFQHIPWSIDEEPPFLVDSYSGHNLIMLTIGSHLTKLEDFQRNLHELLVWIDEWRRPNDIVFFISAVPGTKCTKAESKAKMKKLEGTSSHSVKKSKHQRSVPSLNLIESYNEYAKEVLAEQQILYLDVLHPTTQWRERTENNCDPDPLDWWIHFLFTALLDMGTASSDTIPQLIATTQQ